MARTIASLVSGILGDDYDRSTNLNQFIQTATVIVNRVKACAIDKETPLTSEELELIERWLAAHYYCQSDKTYTSKSTGGASGSFSGQTAKGIESTLYGQTALDVDFSGCLRNITQVTVAGGSWLGKASRDQQSWSDRNE